MFYTFRKKHLIFIEIVCVYFFIVTCVLHGDRDPGVERSLLLNKGKKSI